MSLRNISTSPGAGKSFAAMAGLACGGLESAPVYTVRPRATKQADTPAMHGVHPPRARSSRLAVAMALLAARSRHVGARGVDAVQRQDGGTDPGGSCARP